MKELIDKMALGVIEYEKPVLVVSVSEINDRVNCESVLKSSIEVHSENGMKVKGVVYSTNENVHIVTKDFYGTSAEIEYHVDTESLEEGEQINGCINIVSDGGEVSVPFTFTVDSVCAMTSLGEIKNLFHFANLVQMSYSEAENLFKSNNFPHIFLENDNYLLSVYEGLKNSPDTGLAIEEFLIAANKKKEVGLVLSQTEKKYDYINEDEKDSIVITKDNWGYVCARVYTEGDFIDVAVNKIDSEDFVGSNYEFSYIIRKDKLNRGKNFGKVIFCYRNREYVLNICVSAKEKLSEDRHLVKKYACEIIHKYLDFRLRRISSEKWMDETLELVERVRNIDDTSVFMRLLHAQLCISKGLENDAQWLLESAAENILADKENNMELYCYYLYVRILQKRDKDFTDEMIRKIKDIYDLGYNTSFILWILFYVDNSYNGNESIKLVRIKEQFAKGMRSPLMYFEAFEIFNENPGLLRVLDDFEIQVLNFGSKQGVIGKRLAQQIAELVMRYKEFNYIIFNILTGLFDIYESEDILTAIVSMLIKGQKTEKKYFKWYEKAVSYEIKITSLYEYFMYSVPDDYTEQYPRMILLYFGFNNGLSDEKQAMVYDNIIRYKDNLPGIYETNERQIELFASKCLEKGKINEHLAVIYSHVLKKAMVTVQSTKVMPQLLNTYLIRCEDSIKEICIIQKELTTIKTYPVVDKKAYVQMYSEDAAIIFTDINGDKYVKTVDYTITRLLDMEEYLEYCYTINPESTELTLYFSDQYLRYKKNPFKAVDTLRRLHNNPDVRNSYKKNIEKEIINIYADNYDLEAADEFLISVKGDNISTDARRRIVELLIMRGMYDKAYEFVNMYGYWYVSVGRLLRCVSKLIDERHFEKDDKLVEMAMFVYRKGKYNENVLGYLCSYYYGTLKEMYDIWKTCKDFGYFDMNINEKILVQNMFSEAFAGDLSEIFDEYYRCGMNIKVIKAFIFYNSYNYFVKETEINNYIFKYIFKELYDKKPVHDICILAYLKYCSEKDSLSGEEINIVQELVFEMNRKNIFFEFFRKFKKYFRLSAAYEDKTIVEYRTNPDYKVYIHYILETGYDTSDTYTVKEMKQVVNGVFTADFTLFMGEQLKYYITEENGCEQVVTESRNLSLSDRCIMDNKEEDSRYSRINDLIMVKDLNECSTVENMAAEYLVTSKLGEKLFTI